MISEKSLANAKLQYDELIISAYQQNWDKCFSVDKDKDRLDIYFSLGTSGK